MRTHLPFMLLLLPMSLGACGGLEADVDTDIGHEASAVTSPTLQLVTDGSVAAVLIALANGAKKTLDLIVYEYAASNVRIQPINLALQQAARRGVKVRVLLDAQTSGNAEAETLLKGLGIDAKLSSKAHRAHNKATCADGAVLLAGSSNLSTMSLFANHETNFLVRVKAAAQQWKKYFDALWTDSSALITIAPTTSRTLQVLGDGQYGARALASIGGAKHSVALVMYNSRWLQMNTPSIRNQLVDALRDAKARGVPVRVVFERGGNATVTAQNQETAARLRSGGVEVRFDPLSMTTHAKALVADDDVITGSTNWTSEAIENYHATDIWVRKTAIAEAARAYFDSLWSAATP